MNVDEFLIDLYGDELSDMFIGNRNSKEEPRSKLLPLMNKAMTQAYAKYDIKFSTTMLQVTADEDTYILDADDSLRIMAITAVTNSYGRELGPDEVRVLGSTLFFPEPKEVELEVAFKVKPVRFDIEQDDEEVILDLPELLVPWMSSWVAARIFLSRKDEASQAEGAKYLQLAQSFAQAFESTNTTNQYTREDTAKLCTRGFP